MFLKRNRTGRNAKLLTGPLSESTLARIRKKREANKNKKTNQEKRLELNKKHMYSGHIPAGCEQVSKLMVSRIVKKLIIHLYLSYNR